MLIEIGSNFWEYSLNSSKRNDLFFWQDSIYNKQYFKSGRNAIKALCRNLITNKKSILLPIYTCETCIQPFIDEGWEVSFYCLNKDLSINEKKFIKLYNEKKPSVIFFHSFFGFNTLKNEDFFSKYKKDGVVIVEDMTQSLFSQHHLQSADYYVTSFRKFLAIPEGGALISKRKFIDYDIFPADDTIEIVALDAFKLKKEYFENPVLEKKKLFREKYSELNSLICQNDKLQMMGEISKKILFSCDKERITNIRKNNYKYLYDTISSLKDVEIVFGNNLNEVCPLYFPVYVNDRENVQLYLSKYDIYCPIIWKKDKNIVTEDNATRYMYSHMLCIPIDQRYGQLEMNRVVESLSKYSC